jgi:DNA topoisomerase-3
VFEAAQAYVCERAVGPDKTCDFRSGRVILQRPVERPQMEKLLASGKTDLLQFVSARTRRAFSAFLVRQPDGKIGFEFEAKDKATGGARKAARGGPTPLRVLGPHPRDRKPVELYAGRYGPYVKHGAINATVPDRDRVDLLTLDEAIALVDAKTGAAAAPGAGHVAATLGAKRAKAPPIASTATTKAAASKSRKATTAKAKPKAKPAPKTPGRGSTAKSRTARKRK